MTPIKVAFALQQASPFSSLISENTGPEKTWEVPSPQKGRRLRWLSVWGESAVDLGLLGNAVFQSEPWGSVFKQSSPQTSGSPIVSSLNPTPFWNEPSVFNRKQANRKHTLIIPPKMEDKVQYSALNVSVMFKCIFCNRNILQCFLSLIILWNSAALEVSWSNYIL